MLLAPLFLQAQTTGSRDLVDVKAQIRAEVAHNSSELANLRQKGERDFFEFDIRKDVARPLLHVADIQLALEQADPQHGTFNLVIQVDENRLEKTSQPANVPIQFLVGRDKLRYEVVVNFIDTDRIRGYVSTPNRSILDSDRARQSQPSPKSVASQDKATSAEVRRTSVQFEGRAVTVTIPKLDKEGFFPEGPSTVCIEGPPNRQCYTAPEDHGIDPQVEVVELSKGKPALLFSAFSGGVSGSSLHLALLRPGRLDALDNMISVGPVSNQSEHAFWTEPKVSQSPIFVVADFVWGPNESHYSEHRFVISAYVYLSSDLVDDPMYYLDDKYLTLRRYDQDAGDHILISERTEILKRLMKVKAERERKKRPPKSGTF